MGVASCDDLFKIYHNRFYLHQVERVLSPLELHTFKVVGQYTRYEAYFSLTLLLLDSHLDYSFGCLHKDSAMALEAPYLPGRNISGDDGDLSPEDFLDSLEFATEYSLINEATRQIAKEVVLRIKPSKTKMPMPSLMDNPDGEKFPNHFAVCVLRWY